MSIPTQAVFLSYASQDAEAAKRICEALRAVGLDVWFDQSELRGGDAWDASIRKQIKECALFVPIISANTQAREEGYFRREWNLAVSRTLDMADDKAFLLPVVIDATLDMSARVPEKFREVQWTHLPAGESSPAFVARVARLLSADDATKHEHASPNARTTSPASDSDARTGSGSSTRAAHAPRAFRRSRSAVMLLIVAGVAAVGIAGWGARQYLFPASTVVPYSFEDRRMTFAVLPFQAPADDMTGAQVAVAMTEAVQAVEERNVVWAQVASRRSVEEASTRHTATKDLGSALNVHFLLRGNVTRVASGYNAEILVVDAATERVLGTKSLAIAAGALTPRRRDDLKYALGDLTFYALEAEVQRARTKPVEALDVRDLSFRANVDWFKEKERKDEKGAYSAATVLLNRALALAPDDPLALFMTAKVNLCDCVMGWSKNVEEQQAVGVPALEKYLRHDPDHQVMLALKSNVLALRGRYEESLLIVDSMLKRNPENAEAFAIRAYSLLRLGRPQEALTSLNEVFEHGDEDFGLAASIHYELAHYELSAQMAQKAIAQMDRADLSNPRMGGIGLTLVAAEARLGRLARANAAMADFNAAVPGVRTIAAMKKWLHPAADLAGYGPLFDGLRLAGIGE